MKLEHPVETPFNAEVAEAQRSYQVSLSVRSVSVFSACSASPRALRRERLSAAFGIATATGCAA